MEWWFHGLYLFPILMKTFFHKLFKYTIFIVGITLIYNVIGIAFNHIIWRTPKFNKTDICAFGDSHLACSLNDTLLNRLVPNKTFYNLGKGGQSLFWNVLTARAAYQQGCRNFIFEINPGLLQTTWKTTDIDRGVREIFKKYYITPTEFLKIAPKNWLFTLKLIYENPFYRNPIDGGFNARKSEFQAKKGSETTEEEKKGIIYDPTLSSDLLIQFIKEHHQECKFLLYTSPVYQWNEKHSINPLISTTFVEIKDMVLYKDYSNFFKNTNNFSDAGHLNFSGADTFTRKFSPIISQTF